MPTLQILRKYKYRTIKAFAEAYGCSPSKASGILRGFYHFTLSKGDVTYLAEVLGVSFLTCAEACDNTFAELKGYKGDAWKKTARTHKGIWARWQWEDDLFRDTKKAAESDDWAEYRRKYMHEDTHEQREQPRTNTQTSRKTCFSILGVPSTATSDQIKTAFRAKVRAASDGKGGYRGDMDRLVHAKEQALEYALSGASNAH